MQTLTVGRKEKLQFLKENSYFQAMEGQALEEICQGTFLRRYQRGEIVCWQGEPCAGLFMIRRGSVKLFKISARGRELIIRVFEDGASLNEVPVFDRGNNPVNVAVLEDSEIWTVESQVIQRAIDNHPEMARAVIRNLSANLSDIFYRSVQRCDCNSPKSSKQCFRVNKFIFGATDRTL